MGIFSGSKEKRELVLVFDIGSSSVGGALFWTNKNAPPQIIFSDSEPITLEENFNLDKFLILTTKALDVLTSRILLKNLGAPKKIFCVLSSPWYISQTRVVSMQKNTNFVFTSKIADGLIQKEVGLFKEEHFKKYIDAGSPLRLIETKNIKITLNGYETIKPLNQKAKELEMILFLSMSPEQVLKKIEETIFKHFHLKEIKFSSFAMASFTITRDIFPQTENFLLIDIGGEVTDISMIKKNILRESTSFPFGKNFIIRGAASALSSSIEEAKSLISLFQSGHAVEETAKKLELAVADLKTKWLEQFQESLANLSSDISIPSNIYLSTDKDLSSLFCEIIKNEQFNQYTLTDSKFEVALLDTKAFHGLALFKEDAVRDPFLIMDSIYINRFLN